MSEAILTDHAAYVIGAPYRVEVIVEVGDNKHDDEVWDDVELSLAVRQKNVDIRQFNQDTDAKLHDTSDECNPEVSELPRMIYRVLHHLKTLLELTLHLDVHDDHRYDSGDAVFDR